MIFLASGGAGRMTIELYKTFVIKHVPGKFKSSVPKNKSWVGRRNIVIAPYIFTWMVFASLLFYSV